MDFLIWFVVYAAIMGLGVLARRRGYWAAAQFYFSTAMWLTGLYIVIQIIVLVVVLTETQHELANVSWTIEFHFNERTVA